MNNKKGILAIFIFLSLLVIIFFIGKNKQKQNSIYSDNREDSLSCSKEGEDPAKYSMPGKSDPRNKPCCKGLKAIQPRITSDETIRQGGCWMSAGGAFICAACGDGNCDAKYEDSCNCAEDCRR